MASKVGIWNAALQRLGTRRVETDTEATAEAEALDAIYDESRLFVLEQHPWTFARVAAQLSRLVDTPVEVWKYFYETPSDLVRILRVSDGTDNNEFLEGDSIPYERQFDDRIATDAEEVYLYYLKDVTDVNLMTSSFRSALAWRLAYEVAPRLTGSMSKMEMAETRYVRELEVARSQDSQRSRVRKINPTSWIRAREAGTNDSLIPDI